MRKSQSSALIVDNGRRVLLRIRKQVYECTQDELRIALGLPPGPAGLGISIEGDKLTFEFAADGERVVLAADQLSRRLAKLTEEDQRARATIHRIALRNARGRMKE